MPKTSWSQLASELTSTLHLARHRSRSRSPMRRPRASRRSPSRCPGALPDGRTGRVPAGCVFWMKATESTFSTVAEDHGNCSVGSMTHGFKTLEEVAGNSDVAALLESGWVTMDVVPQIPVVHEKPGAVTYGPLADTPVDPDVVFLRVTGRQLMVLSDAIPGLRIEGKPQCHIVAIAKEEGVPAASVGMRAEPCAHRHAAHRDDVRDPGVTTPGDPRVDQAQLRRRQHRRPLRRRRRPPLRLTHRHNEPASAGRYARFGDAG